MNEIDDILMLHIIYFSCNLEFHYFEEMFMDTFITNICIVNV